MKKRATLFSKNSFRVLSLAIALGITPNLYAQVATTFTGTVYRDANGLTDNAINGTPIGNIATGLQPAKQIYVYLLETVITGPTSSYQEIVQKAAVSTTVGTVGQYSIPGFTATDYNLSISTANLLVGEIDPLLGFPTAIAATAEGTTTLGDGTPNFSVALNTANNGLSINFGIELRPVGNDYIVSNPTLVPGPTPAQDSILVPAAAFAAFDPEDGTYTTGLAGRTVHLLQANGGRLYYNGRLITATSLSSSTGIKNFTSDSIRFVRNAGALTFSFPFSSEDNAEIYQFTPNTITLKATPLPVALLSFEVHRQGSSAIVRWNASSEAAGLGFDVERSTDGQHFTTVGHVASVTEGNTTVDYRFEDSNLPAATASGKIYYRLRQTDFNGQADYSKVDFVTSSGNPESTFARLSLYPNPASNVLNVSLNGAQGQMATVVLSDATGRVVDRKTTNSEGSVALEVSSLPAGMYFVQYRTEAGELTTERIAITR